MRTVASSGRIDLFYANDNGGFHPDRRVELDSAAGSDGGWHTYAVDFNTDLEWLAGGTVTAFRLDPTSGNGAIGETFEIDYIRFQEQNFIIPEPGTAALFLVGMALFRGMRKSDEYS